MLSARGWAREVISSISSSKASAVSLASRFASPSRVRTRPRVVILGTGWGSFSLLRHLDHSLVDIAVVSPRNHFLFTPLLASTTVGTLEFRSIVEYVRATIRRKQASFHLSEATDIDLRQRRVRCRSILDSTEYDVAFDRLVVGVGARTNTFSLPGVEDHAFFIKEVRHAQRLRAAIIERLELAMTPGHDEQEVKRLLHFVVVGGGPTGIEFSGELYDFMTQDVARFYPELRPHMHVTVVEAGEILSLFDAQLRSFAQRRIATRTEVQIVKKQVASISPTSVTFTDRTTLPAGLVVWSAGVAAQPLVAALQWPKSTQQRLLVDPYLRVYADESGATYALGDCSHVLGQPLPATAQVAEREGRYLADEINAWARASIALQDRNDVPSAPADLSHGPLRRETMNTSNDPLVAAGTDLPDLPPPLPGIRPFQYASVGMLAYLGGYSALAQLPSAKLKGWWSWLLWRSAYLTKLGSWRARLQVPVDWAKTLLMGRDISRF